MRIRTRALTIVVGIAAGLSCRSTFVGPMPSSSVPLASDTIVVSGAALRLRVFLNRDFMPSTQPDTRMMAIVRLVPESGHVPEGLSVEHATFSLGVDKWDVVPTKEASWPDYLEVVARSGPTWPVGSKIAVFLQVKDASGKSYLMRANDIVITRSE